MSSSITSAFDDLRYHHDPIDMAATENNNFSARKRRLVTDLPVLPQAGKFNAAVRTPRAEIGVKSATILVAEDDEQLRDFLKLFLGKHGYQVVAVKNGVDAVHQCVSGQVDLVLLDLTMPRMDGFTALQKIRFFSKVPILILSAFNNPSGTIKALDMGADGYIVKPFAVQEFIARIESVLRRVSWAMQQDDQHISVGNVLISKELPQAVVCGKHVQLTITEHKILLCLAAEAGKTVSKEQILKKVWQHTFSDTSILTQNMHRLRSKLQRNADGHQLIKTEYGVGYRLQTANLPA